MACYSSEPFFHTVNYDDPTVELPLAALQMSPSFEKYRHYYDQRSGRTDKLDSEKIIRPILWPICHHIIRFGKMLSVDEWAR